MNKIIDKSDVKAKLAYKYYLESNCYNDLEITSSQTPKRIRRKAISLTEASMKQLCEVHEKKNHKIDMMKTKSVPKNVQIKHLKLDFNNPRFAELYSGSNKEDELIEYLLYNESAEDVAKGIVNAGEFYPDRPLWVLEIGNDYLVKDGNRRCAAVKALQFPDKYGLTLPKTIYKELPTLVYNSEAEVGARILQEHANSLFREWDRIAKALEVYKLFTSGSSLDSMTEIDSHPTQLIKLASFYYEAVKIGGEDLKKLLRRGRGKTGGKTIIFERMFRFSTSCGYNFKNKPSYQINITDQTIFDSYVSAMVEYLKANPVTKTDDVDAQKDSFLKLLIPYGFKPAAAGSAAQSNVTAAGATQTQPIAAAALVAKTPARKKSIKDKPIYTRKKIPAPLERVIKECYSLDQNNFSNAKTALARVTFECTLKFIVENTIYKASKNLYESAYFRNVFYDGKGIKRPYTDFTKLKALFSELILNTCYRKAFENFDLERMHQIIHNYKVGAVPADAKGVCDNLVPLLEFMLNDEPDLISSLDLSKLP